MSDSNTLLAFKDMLDGTSDDDSEETQLCPISGAPPGENAVRLPCGHTFAYSALFLETRTLRCRVRPYDVDHISRTHLRCPYCRDVSPGLLPYVPSLFAERVPGVNAPQRSCRAHVVCAHQIARGPRKGNACGRAGFVFEGQHVCPVHWRAAVRAKKVASAWTNAHEETLRKNTCKALRQALGAQGLSTTGSKKVLVARLLSMDVDQQSQEVDQPPIPS